MENDICTVCFVGKVILIAKSGRTHRLIGGEQGQIPDNFKMPTCNKCGAEFVDDNIAAELSKMTNKSAKTVVVGDRIFALPFAARVERFDPPIDVAAPLTEEDGFMHNVFCRVDIIDVNNQVLFGTYFQVGKYTEQNIEDAIKAAGYYNKLNNDD